MSSTPEWSPIFRNYDSENIRYSLPTSDAIVNHPFVVQLKKNNNKDTYKENEKLLYEELDAIENSTIIPVLSKETFIDPLGISVFDPLLNNSSNSIKTAVHDPLLNPTTSSLSTSSVKIKDILNSLDKSIPQTDALNSNANPWLCRKENILNDYAVSGSITLNSAAIDEISGTGLEDGSNARHLDKYNQRLANLEKRKFKENTVVVLTYKEYFEHVDRLASDLNRAWSETKLVDALRIVIQLCKLLSDTTAPSFYPFTFVKVTEVLDRFGDMVFQRLKTKAEESIRETNQSFQGLSDEFTAAEIPFSTKDTARNWFYKAACVRELLPRVYVELALFKCYRFLTSDTGNFESIISRIASVIRGMGDPLKAMYARAYLIIRNHDVVPQSHSNIEDILEDSFVCLSVLREDQDMSFTKASISIGSYVNLLSPAVEWLIYCAGVNANREVFQRILQFYRDYSNESMVLKHIIDSFDGNYFSHGSLGMAALIKASEPSVTTVVDVLASFGKQLSIHPPPEEQRIPLLNEVWKVVAKSPDIYPYIRCCSAWLDVVQKFYSERELFVILANLATRIQEGITNNNNSSSISGGTILQQNSEVSEQTVLHHLEEVLLTITGKSSSFCTAVIGSEYFLQIIDVFKESRKVFICKEILDSFRMQPVTNDAVLINTLFDICRIVHDSIDCLSDSSEISSAAILICSFIDKISFGRDLEQQLNFYCDCRAAFCNIDQIKAKLINSVAELTMKTYKIMKGKHSKKTSTFVKACLAYCHITIPSLIDLFSRLKLLLLCAEISLINQCLPQTDCFLKASISIIPDLPSHYYESSSSSSSEGRKVMYEDVLVEYISELLSFLLLVPGHPEYGPFFIVQGLMNAIPRYSAWQPYSGNLLKVYMNIMNLLCSFAQRKFIYNLQGVESNDTLYGGSIAYMAELSEQLNICVSESLKQLTILNDCTENVGKLCQARGAMILVNHIAIRMEITTSVGLFLLRLLELAKKHKSLFTSIDQSYYNNTIIHLMKSNTTTTTTTTSIITSSVDKSPTRKNKKVIQAELELTNALKLLLL